MIVGYRELREMRNSLRLALSDPALTPASERGFLAVALEAYLWSSVLIHPSYRSLLTKGEGGTASSTAGGPTADPAALLDFAKREAAETVETLDADAGSPRALLPRIYIQMGNRLSTSSHIADQLQALQFFWRASTHGRLILAIDGLQPTPR
jgi:hypothetical protein